MLLIYSTHLTEIFRHEKCMRQQPKTNPVTRLWVSVWNVHMPSGRLTHINTFLRSMSNLNTNLRYFYSKSSYFVCAINAHLFQSTQDTRRKAITLSKPNVQTLPQLQFTCSKSFSVLCAANWKTTRKNATFNSASPDRQRFANFLENLRVCRKTESPSGLFICSI